MTVSDSYPPAPQPPGQEPAPEYLEAGAGGPLSPAATPPKRGTGRRRGLLIAGGVAALALVGVGTWAATQFFATGAQPSEALPAGTIGYASIDLDPSGAQKIEALRTLNKFPAFKDEVGLNAEDDIREKIFDAVDLPASCKVFYSEDIEPWLGSRFAVAAVDTGDGKATPVAVLQVTDADRADAGLKRLQACAPSGDSGSSGGWVIDGDWAIVAQTQQQAQAVADLTDKGTLADDEDFQKLTSAAGDAGIVSLYAAPDAGRYLGPAASGAEGMFSFGPTSGFGGDSDTLPPADDMTDALKGFGGMAVTVRFDSGALEVESAGGSSALGLDALYSSDRGADVLETLPDDTAAAIGVGFDEGWVKALADRLSSFTGEDGDQLLKDASDATGLALPADLETLFGRSAALSFSSDFDPETFFNSSDGSDLPVAMKVQGDPEQIQAVLDKIVKGNPQEPDAATLLGTDVDGDTIVIGPNADYRAQVLAKGTLGQNHVYQDVVRESDQASAVLFVNFDAGDDWLARLAGDDQSVQENVAPLAGFGVTGWSDDDYVHSVLRLTTD